MDAQGFALGLHVIESSGQWLDFFELVGEAVEDFHGVSCFAK